MSPSTKGVTTKKNSWKAQHIASGFSDDENLIRLQRCLKGPALKAVRSRLLCLASVPHVIRTLEMRYGRPETLIRSIAERVRRPPALRINDPDGIIEFGLVVDNLIQHLNNAGQQAHLTVPGHLAERRFAECRLAERHLAERVIWPNAIWPNAVWPNLKKIVNYNYHAFCN